MGGPLQIIADYFGIPPEDVRDMTTAQLDALRTRVRAELDQTEAEIRDLRFTLGNA